MRLLAVVLCIVLLPGPAWAAVGCTCYVRSTDGDDADDCSTWALAKATLANAATNSTASTDIICVSDAHAETQSSSMTISASGDSETVPLRIYAVEDADDSYLPGTSAQVSVTGTNNDINLDGDMKIFGVYFSTGDDFSFQTALNNVVLTDVYIMLTSNGSALTAATAQAQFEMHSSTVNFSNASGGTVRPGEYALFEGVTFLGDVAAGGLFNGWFARTSIVTLLGCDLSAYSSETIFDLSAQTAPYIYNVIGSTLPDTVTIHDGNWANSSLDIISIISTDDTTAFGGRREQYTIDGDVKISTSIYEGFTFTEGSTGASMEINPATTVNEAQPLCSWWNSTGWIDASSNTASDDTFEVEITEDFSSALTQGDAWVELAQPGTASSTLYSLENFGGEIGGSTALTAGDSGDGDWTGEPGAGSGSRYHKLEHTFDINDSGEILWRVCIGIDSAGDYVHVDLQPTVTIN